MQRRLKKFERICIGHIDSEAFVLIVIKVIFYGVTNMEKSMKFYRYGLGFNTNQESNNPGVIFFNTTGTKFELYTIIGLTEDINESSPPQIGIGF